MACNENRFFAPNEAGVFEIWPFWATGVLSMIASTPLRGPDCSVGKRGTHDSGPRRWHQETNHQKNGRIARRVHRLVDRQTASIHSKSAGTTRAPPRTVPLGIVQRSLLMADNSPLPRSATWTMTLGGTPKQPTNDMFVNSDPAWSPHGSKSRSPQSRQRIGHLDSRRRCRHGSRADASPERGHGGRLVTRWQVDRKLAYDWSRTTNHWG